MTNLPIWEPGTKELIDDGTGRAAWYRVLANRKYEVCTKSGSKARIRRSTVSDEGTAKIAIERFMEGY